MGKVNFGIIGCGVIGKVHATVIKKIPGSQLVGVFDQNTEMGRSFADTYACKAYDSYKEMLKDDNIDAIAVCLPSGLHSEAVLEAAEAGKHIIVEKPAEITTERIDKMIEACRKNGVKLSVVLQHRFDDVIQCAKNYFQTGNTGKILFGESRTIWYREPEYYTKAKWRGTWSLDGGGALMNQSIHYIDLLLYLMGPVASVCGSCKTLLHKGIETEDTGTALLVFKNGSMGTICGTTLAYPGLHAELNIFSENGCVCIKNDRLDFYKDRTGSIECFEKLLRENTQNGTGASRPDAMDTTSHMKQYLDFADAVRTGREPLVNGEEGRKAVAVIQAIYNSSKTGKWIDLTD